MKILKAVMRGLVLVVIGFSLGLYYPRETKKDDQSKLTNEIAIRNYIASHTADIDLLVINEGFYYSQPGLIALHEQRPDVMCRDLAHKFGLLLDENESEMKIDFFQPDDSIPVWQKDLYFASARYLRKNCGKYAAKWTADSPVWKSYKKAVRFAAITQ